MPRTLTRLRYRPPPKPITFARPSDRLHVDKLLKQRVAAYVDRQSNPRHVKLQVVVNPKARLPPTGKTVIPPVKPFTLRDVVDPKRKARHGEIIYVFRNTRTNQVLYSLQELLEDHHLEQLPFIGKHSKPPTLRPDEWIPHCVISFPTPEQGQNAYRKLREFRKLHELSWDKTNPEWKLVPLKQRIKKIMDQKANMSADLAEVLRLQGEHGAKMSEALEEQQKLAVELMDQKWAEIDALANAAATNEKKADSIKWLQQQIRSLTMKLEMKHNENDADQRRLKNARTIQEIRLRKLKYATQKAEQFKKMQEELTQKAAPANEAGAQQKLDRLRDQARLLQESLDNPDPTRSAEDLAIDTDLLATHQRDIVALQEAFEAKKQAEARDHHVARSILPPRLKKTLPTPYALDDVRVRWADVQDALYARGKWPESIVHEVLSVYQARSEVAFLSPEEYEVEKMNSVSSILQSLAVTRGNSQLALSGATA